MTFQDRSLGNSKLHLISMWQCSSMCSVLSNTPMVSQHSFKLRLQHQRRLVRNILSSSALNVRTGLLTLYQTISRSLPSVLKLHLRVTASPTTTGGRGSMVTVKYPGKQRRKANESRPTVSI